METAGQEGVPGPLRRYSATYDAAAAAHAAFSPGSRRRANHGEGNRVGEFTLGGTIELVIFGGESAAFAAS